ncbi:DUF3102 domain-containing protein [Paenibacillus sp. NAIST15-1]|uniref:DUF3102 domain-containing protein n=1 Tax=Paenibacillus sp. NAIST15-1 TaxID=1605994 RepID=UPI0008688009|nr:DUF3102 domain-containing protein [Paenibacillus sp. NAIST15-1]GAV13255.1 hypothetical protein PBN151_3189 [Paenibacillus sp. NAIST15-1]
MTQVSRSVDIIAAEIRSIDAQAREMVLRSAMEIGKRLKEVKELVPHGEWGSWLKENVEYSQSTANNFMRLADEYGSNSQALGNMSYTKALALLGVPTEEREQFAAENEDKSARELQQVIKEKKQLEKQLKAAEKERAALQKLNEQLEEAQADFDEEQEQRLKDEIQESRERIKQLESELKAKPIDVAVVEKIPEAVEKELEELRKKAVQPGNDLTIKFKYQFDSLVVCFKDILSTLSEMQGDAELHEKYKGAVRTTINKMNERL